MRYFRTFKIILSSIFILTLTGCDLFFNETITEAPKLSLISENENIAPKNQFNTGNTYTGSQRDILFQIKNAGTSSLTISEVLINSSDLTVKAFPGDPLGPGNQSPLILTLTPTLSRKFESEVVIVSNDPAVPRFTFYITGTSVTPGEPVVTGTPLTSSETVTLSWTPFHDADAYRYRINYGEWIVSEDINVTSCTLSLPEGIHTFELQARYATVWSASSVFNTEIDRTPPEPALITGQKATNSRPQWTWSGSEETVEYRYRINSSPWTFLTADISSVIPESELPPGNALFELQSSDKAGNWSDSARFLTILDYTAPAKPLLAGTALTNNQTPLWNWSLSEDTSSVRFRINSQEWQLKNSSETSYTPPAPLNEGVVVFEIQAADLAGNWSETSSFTTHIDLTAPSVPVVTGSGVTNNPFPQWSWDIPEGVIAVRYRINNAAWGETGNSIVFTPSSELPEGHYTFEVQFMDDSGNWSESGSFLTQIDMTPPSPPVISGESLLADPKPQFLWTTSESTHTVRYRINNSHWTEIPESQSNSFQASSAMSDGSYTLEVQASDNVGNWSVSAIHSFVIDTTPPAVPVLTGEALTNNQRPEWKWDSSGYTTYARFNNGSWVRINTDLYTPENNLSEGFHTLEIYLEDEAGNRSSVNSFTTEIDITPPKKVTVYGIDRVAVTKPTWNWNDYREKGEYFLVRINNNPWTMTTTTLYTSQEELPPGTHTFELKVSDATGNESEISKSTTVIDLSSPPQPLLTNIEFNQSRDLIFIDLEANHFNIDIAVIERTDMKSGVVDYLEKRWNGRTSISLPYDELKTYSYRIKAVNEFGESSYSNKLEGTAPLKTPWFYTETRDYTGEGNKLCWINRSVFPTKYVLERKISGVDADYTPLRTFFDFDSEYIDLMPPEGGIIYYRLKAVYTYEEVQYESEWDIAIADEYFLPPTDFTISAFTPYGYYSKSTMYSNITLSWKDNSNKEEGYRIYKSTRGTYSSYYELIVTLPPDSTEFSESGTWNYDNALNNSYKVEAFKGDEVTHFREIVVQDNPVIHSVANFQKTSWASDHIQLSWLHNMYLPFLPDGYILEKKSSRDRYWSRIPLHRDQNQYTDTDVLPGQTYEYRIQLYKGKLFSYYSTLEHTVKDNSQIYNLSGIPETASKNSLTWNLEGQLYSNKYEIFRRRFGTQNSFISVGTTYSTNFTDTKDLLPDTGYEYKVSISNGSTHWGTSAVIVVKTHALPTPPQNALITPKHSASSGPYFNITWTPPSDTDGVNIDKYLNNEYKASVYIAKPTSTYTDYDVHGSVPYTYILTSVNSNGTSKQVVLDAGALSEHSRELIPDTVFNGNITYSDTILYFHAYIPKNTPYTITWDDSAEGSGQTTIDIRVSAYENDWRTILFSRRDNGYFTPYQGSFKEDRTLVIKVEKISSITLGNFKIAVLTN